jgi:tetratricopeptide (TPR) repeat protein
MSGANVRLDDIVGKVYLPGREGSLQLELVAATRSSGRLPYVIDGTMAAIRKELWAGRPVLILQNLGVATIARWHYAVVVGVDSGRGEVILRSGTDRRRIMELDTFLRTWRRGEYWAMVVLRPDELPASVDRERYFTAISALEETGQLESAGQAWQTAAIYWPDDHVVRFGIANVAFARGDFVAAEEKYRELLQDNGALVIARNNLALALAEQRRFDEASAEIGRAIADNDDPAVAAELRDTQQMIAAMREGKR